MKFKRTEYPTTMATSAAMSFLSMANNPYLYEYMGRNVQLPSKKLPILLPDKCPCCGKVLSTEILPIRAVNNITDNEQKECTVISIYRCTSCNELFTVINTVKTKLVFDDEKFDTDNAISEPVGIYPFEMENVEFDEDISDLSSSFVEVYKQAERAEHDGLNLICGMAYRRALEFLVRDYCVDKFPEKVSEIDTKSLSEKIKNYITDDSDIKTLAEKATWLGNDQTHVINKHPDRDVNDIKQFIQMIVAKIKIKMVVADAETIKKG